MPSNEISRDTIAEKGDIRYHEGSSTASPKPEDHVVGAEAAMTWKTWLVIFILSSCFGLSFWPVPTTAAMQGKLGAKLGDATGTSIYWYIPAYTTGCALGFLIAGANSDLLGRRMFLYRHIGITISDGFVFLIVIIGPIVGRYAIDVGDGWRFIFYGGFIAQIISLISLALLYHPPKHPRGVPWKEAIRGLDYVGTVLVTPGVCLVLVGIISTTYMKSTSVRVLAPMCAGFGLLVLFGLWETFSKVKYPLCPPRIFRSHYGREFTVPFIIALIVTMFYYGINIIYPTMVNVFYITAESSRSDELLLTLPGNLGLVFGAMLLICFGNLFGHWKWTLVISWAMMTLFGGLMAMVTPFNK
ncbi:hypothetical protein LTR95_014595, partial [Oleoguttula sp. CCFEE 5521]